MSVDIEFWSRDAKSTQTSFDRRVDPSGLSLFSSSVHTSNKIGDYNDSTCISNKRQLSSAINNTKFVNSTGVSIKNSTSQLEASAFTSSQKTSLSILASAPSLNSIETVFTTVSSSSQKRVSSRQSDTIELRKLPNYLSTLNVRFTSSSNVNVTNGLFEILSTDGTTSPSGIDFKMAEIIHPSTSKSVIGSGDASWQDLPSATGVSSDTKLSVTDNPGVSGLTFGVSSNRHDWFVAISKKDVDIGVKDFTIKFTVDYL